MSDTHPRSAGTQAPTRVLVTGAGGLLGRAVLAHLRARGIAATALERSDPGDLLADRVRTGDAGDPDTVRAALADVDAVIHLAALPTPTHGTPLEVFGGNTRATFTVLEEAGNAGVRRAMIASSYSVLGLTYSTTGARPPYYPLDTDTPLQASDPYALSKQVDEATAATMTRRHGMTTVALRYPFVSDARRMAAHRAADAARPGLLAAESWAYLDVHEAARAALLAVTAPLSGHHVLFVAAPHTLADRPTEELIAAHHPATAVRRPIPGRATPIDLAPARDLLGFTARDTEPAPERDPGDVAPV
ncbi:NAD-dependent epimerase/dehydratase family protein [Streptomyces sp. SPB074]|uniref:NAD-dependent epimerase/dehydratase family protein n=1 Tax=Streptomyces sp. (strain SPB074) TaxID=465543 RepID=UPI00017F0ED0|nr:NAD(P)-dependent oxidoreductase [Streptomyces sp. SPB074]EDY45726.1 vegetative cell wall protein gp1 [Streptomyces sp. SPB074]